MYVAVFNTQVAGSILLLLYEEHSFGTDAPEAGLGIFYNYHERKSLESSWISINLCPIGAAFGAFLTNSYFSLTYFSISKYVIPHRSEFGTVLWRLRPNPAESREYS